MDEGGAPEPGGIRLLGPTTVEGPSGPEGSTRPLECTLLALLASRPGALVGLETLIDELWGESLPQDPRASLRTQVARVRSWLARGGVDRRAIRFAHGGYRLAVAPETVDLVRFTEAVERSEAAEGAEAVIAACDDALAEWRGDPFAGCAVGLVLEAEQVRCREQRLQVIERRAAALLALDRAPEAVVELVARRREHPSRERLTELLMVALYRTGRQQEALAAYTETRRHLADEHGLAPGPGLVRAEAQVLGHDPALLLARGPGIARGARTRPLIVGRDDELARIAVRLGDASGGALVVVTGEAGAGKTTLVEAAAHDAAARGARVGSGSFDESAPLSGWRQALGEIGVDPAVLADDATPRARAVRAALAGTARARGTIVVLEDAHLADGTSLGMLTALARLGLPPGVLVVVTARVPDVARHEGWAATSADLARIRDAVLIGLGPLTRDHADALVAASLTDLPPDAVDRLAGELWERTGGHALHLSALLHEMAGASSEEECLAAATTLPDQLRPLLDHQLGSLPEACRDLVEVLAVVGPTTIDDLAVTSGIEPLDALRALRPARERGLVVDDGGTIALRHALTAAAALDAMGPTVRAHLHHRRYAALAAQDADPFVLLHHAEHAGELVGAASLASTRLRAGRAAYARGAFAEAVALLRAAAESAQAAPEHPDRIEVDLRLGLALAASGQGPEADDLLDAVVADPGATVDQVVVAAVGDEALGLRVAGDQRRLARLERARATTGTAPAPARIEVLRGLLIEESFAHDRRPSDDARSELEGLVAAHGPELDAVAQARLAAMAAREVVEMPVTAASRLALAEEALTTAVASGRSSLVLDARELLVSALLAAGEPERVEDAWYALRHDADRVGRPRARWSASLLPAAVALAEGRVEEADELADRAKSVGEELGIPDAMGAHGVHQVVAHLLEGRLGELTDLVDLVVAVYPAIAAWAAAAALARAQAGDADGALPHLERYVESREAQRTRYFDRPGLCLAAQAAWLVGDDPTTRRVADVVVHALPADPTATVVVGVGAAVLGPVDLHLALAHARLGDVERARSLATSAEALALRLGWRPWVAAARAALDPLTGAEPDQTSPPRPGPAPASSPLGMHRLP